MPDKKPAIIYIVAAGEYEDYRIHGVFLDLAKAKRYLRGIKVSVGDSATIEIWPDGTVRDEEFTRYYFVDESLLKSNASARKLDSETVWHWNGERWEKGITITDAEAPWIRFREKGFG